MKKNSDGDERPVTLSSKEKLTRRQAIKRIATLAGTSAALFIGATLQGCVPPDGYGGYRDWGYSSREYGGYSSYSYSSYNSSFSYVSGNEYTSQNWYGSSSIGNTYQSAQSYYSWR
jgi:hypothetical protein